MAQVTQEDLATALDEFRVELLAMIAGIQNSEEGARHAMGALQQESAQLKTEFFEHVSSAEEKFRADVEEARRQLVTMKGDLSEVKTRLSSLPTHVPETSAFASSTTHLTRRKGFDGLAVYGGGVQWKDWRFSTVRWLQQEDKRFEDLLQKIERLKKEPEEPEDGTPMKIDGEPLSEAQLWCCEEIYALLSQKTKDGPKMIVRNLETLPVSRGPRAWYRLVRDAEG